MGVTFTNGNDIIITTRSEKVASIVRPFHIHSLNGLSDDNCWSIIKAKAFDGNGEVPLEFETIGKEIARRCGSLPLAANVVGGLLHRKTVEEWRLTNEKGLSDEEGHGIGKQKLIELWMGEEFMQPSQGDDMESVGNMYFNVLLQNTLLQVSDKYEYGGACYVMHDLVHDLASSVLNNNADRNTPVRYMFHEGESSHVSKEVAKHLRTLILKGGLSGINFSDFQCLHNLTLGNSREEHQLPDSIGKLIHLRNLDLSNTCIKDLPEWIGELSHLQSLRTSYAQKLPNTLKYLVDLRHLYIDEDVELPVEIGRLTSLRTLPYFKVGEEKGYHIEELGNLNNLKGYLIIENLERVLDKEEALKANVSQKEKLSELQFYWECDCLGERNDESVLEGLRPHSNLKKLVIRGYKGKRFPTWLQGEPQGSCLPLHNLIELKLTGCSECEEITLDHLPNLRSLYIWCLTSLKSLDGLDTLNSLQHLAIQHCDKLKSIGKPSCGEGGNQGILFSLRIIDCRELMEFPHQMVELWAPTIMDLVLDGLRSLTNLPMLIDCLAKSSPLLTDLTIRGIPKLMSAGSVESWDLGCLRELWLETDVSEEWSKETSVAFNETVNGILKGCCNSLTLLRLRGVENWELLPQSIQRLTSVSWLNLENIGIEELPQWFGNLSAIQMLSVWLHKVEVPALCGCIEAPY